MGKINLDDDILATDALGVEWWLTAMSIAKRSIGRSIRMFAGQL